MTRIFLPFLFIVFSIPCFSQANYSVTDPQKDFKEAEYFFLKGEYSPRLSPLETLAGYVS